MEIQTRERLELFIIAVLLLQVAQGFLDEGYIKPTIAEVRGYPDDALVMQYANDYEYTSHKGLLYEVTAMTERMELCSNDSVRFIHPVSQQVYAF